MSGFDYSDYQIKTIPNVYLSIAFKQTNKYYIKDKDNDRYLVVINDNIDWVDKPTDTNMYRDIFQPMSLFLIKERDDERQCIQIQPLRSPELILSIHDGNWLIKKIKYVDVEKRWIELILPTKKDDTSSVNDVIDEDTSLEPTSQGIIEENPIDSLDLSWLVIVSSMDMDELSKLLPSYLVSRVNNSLISVNYIHPSLLYLQWVCDNYDDLPNNVLFLGSNNFKLEDWPLHSEVDPSFSILDYKIRVRDGRVFDQNGMYRDDILREGSCEFSVFAQHILKINQKYLFTSSQHSYLIHKKIILRYPKEYFSSILWRIKNNLTLYPGHYLDSLWGYLTTI